MGGTLIRRWIKALRLAGLHADSQILCACSAGLDSTALTVLIARYGSRLGEIGPILHFNHGWRGAESDADEAHVLRLGEQLGLEVRVGRGPRAGVGAKGESPEARARLERREFFEREARSLGPHARVLTAHHADDLAETLLWRIMTGAGRTHGIGIQAAHGIEMRPALGTTKAELRTFLDEEGISWREDRTNHEGRLLRSRIRVELAPVLDSIFPRWREHLTAEALRLEQAVSRPEAPEDEEAAGELSILSALLGAEAIRPRRAHLAAIRSAKGEGAAMDIALEGGWKLTHQWLAKESKSRWILE